MWNNFLGCGINDWVINSILVTTTFTHAKASSGLF